MEFGLLVAEFTKYTKNTARNSQLKRYIIVLNRGIETEILLNIEERFDIVQFSGLKFSNVHFTIDD